jgi:hypothetical protein
MVSNTKEAIDTIEPVEATSPLSFEITSVDQMYNLFHEWHQQKVGILNHMLSIPEGTVIEDAEGVKHELTNEYLDGFKSGVEVALIELTNLPFQPVTSTGDGV